jgi:hypothetical protein
MSAFRVSAVECNAGWYEEVLGFVRVGEFEASEPGSLWHDGSDRHG